MEEERAAALEPAGPVFSPNGCSRPIGSGVAEAYRQMELPTRQINVKHRKLNKLDKRMM